MAPSRRSAIEGMNHMRNNIKRSAVVGGAVAGLLGAGVALAAWTNYGEGSGSVTAAQAQPLTVTVTNVSGLFPTGSVDVPFTVTNTNPYGVKLTKATLKSVTVDAAHSTCDPTVVTGADITLSDVVATTSTSTSHNFPVTMSNAATDACQGAVFTVTLGVTGLSN
jgi:hypothetical protein